MTLPHPSPVAHGLAAEPVEFRALDACHQAILEHLALFERLVDRTAEGEVDAEARLLASRIEGFFSSVAREHHAEEELRVFPPLLTAGDAQLAQAVQRLQQDHGFIEENWIEIAPQLRALAGGYHWYELDTLRPAARLFCDLLREHIELEESMVYPASRALLVDLLARRSRARAA